VDANPVRAKLLRGETALGVMAFEFFTPGLAPLLAAAGAEFVLFDMEHSGAGIETIKAQVAYARAANVVPMVRVPAGLHHLIAPVLDVGALGIMAPLVETRAQAEAIVVACRYRPQGRRGLAFGVAHDRYTGGSAPAKIAAINDTILTIALIESAAGVAAAHDILSVEGIDMGWIGHYDLSDSLGCVEAFDDPRYRAAESDLKAAATACGKPLGWLVGDGAAARAAFAQGYRCVCIGHEAAVLRSALAREFAIARAPKN
jgi:2-keto-3-deoxy-L-rhamnonate aldolase RhmA